MEFMISLKNMIASRTSCFLKCIQWPRIDFFLKGNRAQTSPGYPCFRVYSSNVTPNDEIDVEIKKLSRRKLVLPDFNVDSSEIQTVTSINLTSYGVSWAKMSQSRDLLDWGFVTLSAESRKDHLITIYHEALQIVNILPEADVYVMEDMPSQKQTCTGAVMANAQLLQLRAILFAYLNGLNKSDNEGDLSRIHKVYFLRRHLAARLSFTLIGGERVSVEDIINAILNIDDCTENYPQFSAINADCVLKDMFLSKKNVEKDHLGWALLLLMAFMDVIVSRRPQSLKILNQKMKN